MNDDPYDRQRRLPEVGDAGQLRIAAAAYEVRGADGALVERDYLERAGALSVKLSPEAAPAAFAHASHFRFQASGSVGAAAWRALCALRSALGVTS